MTRTCTHARCQDCTWTPDPTSRRGPDSQAEAHTKAVRHATETRTLPADDCDTHRDTTP